METLTRSRVGATGATRRKGQARWWILAVILSFAAAIAVTALVASSDEVSASDAPGADVLRRYHSDSLATSNSADVPSSTRGAGSSSTGAPDSTSTESDMTEALRRFHIDSAGG